MAGEKEKEKEKKNNLSIWGGEGFPPRGISKHQGYEGGIWLLVSSMSYKGRKKHPWKDTNSSTVPGTDERAFE